MDTEAVIATTHSPTLGALAKALAKAQGAMTNAAKDKANPHLRSRYADLASIWDACRAALSANDLAVIQTTEPSGPSGVTVVTLLAHASGEWIRGTLFIPTLKSTPQDFGSALTYARRYSLAAMVGVAPGDDDDGERAQGHIPQKEPVRAAPPPQEDEPKEDWAAFEREAISGLAVVTHVDTLAAIAAGISKRKPPKAVRDRIAAAYREAEARVVKASESAAE